MALAADRAETLTRQAYYMCVLTERRCHSVVSVKRWLTFCCLGLYGNLMIPSHLRYRSVDFLRTCWLIDALIEEVKKNYIFHKQNRTLSTVKP